MRVPVKPEILRWACERAGYGRDGGILKERDSFKRLEEWLAEEAKPTFKQLEAFAKATHTPFGYFFLHEPPVEQVPIPDLRTLGGEEPGRPSPNMLDAIYLCQQRQDWYRQYAILNGDDPLPFVGSARVTDNIAKTAASIRSVLDLDNRPLSDTKKLEDAIRLLLERADNAGILAMVSGIVGSNTHRILDVEEFRGFALADNLAPLIFVNGADTKHAQIFTIAHEIAHLWLGQSGVSDSTAASWGGQRVERWCNAVAAEVLVPMESFRESLRTDSELPAETKRLSNRFRVSTLVILRRMLDANWLTREEFDTAYTLEVKRLRGIMAEKSKGGQFYNTAKTRLSPRFASAVIASTWEGRSTFTEAFRLLGCRSIKTMDKIAEKVGVGNPTLWEGG